MIYVKITMTKAITTIKKNELFIIHWNRKSLRSYPLWTTKTHPRKDKSVTKCCTAIFFCQDFCHNSTWRGSNVSVFLMREEWNPYICIKAKSAVRQRVIKALLFKIFFTIHMFCLCTYGNLYTLYENCGNETLNIKHQGWHNIYTYLLLMGMTQNELYCFITYKFEGKQMLISCNQPGNNL